MDDFSHLESSHPVSVSLDSPDTTQKKRDHLDAEPDGRSCFHGSQLTCTEGGEGGGGHIPSAAGNELHPSASGRMEQSKSAEQQGGDHGRAQGRTAKEEVEESVEEEEETAAALGMEDEGEDEEEEKVKEENSTYVTAEPQVGAADVKVQQLLQEDRAKEELRQDSQVSEDLYFSIVLLINLSVLMCCSVPKVFRPSKLYFFEKF